MFYHRFMIGTCTGIEIEILSKYNFSIRKNKPKWLTVAMPFLKITERQERDKRETRERQERDKREMELWLIA